LTKPIRERATNPTFIADKHEEHEEHEEHGLREGGFVSTFSDGRMLLEINAFHDLVAAITAYLGLLEHDLVLALALTGFDPHTKTSRT
jgi:hypothetical protein